MDWTNLIGTNWVRKEARKEGRTLSNIVLDIHIHIFSDTLNFLGFAEVQAKQTMVGAILERMTNGHEIISESLDNCVQEENEAIHIDFNTIANAEDENFKQMNTIDDLINFRSNMKRVDQKGAVTGKIFKYIISCHALIPEISRFAAASSYTNLHKAEVEKVAICVLCLNSLFLVIPADIYFVCYSHVGSRRRIN